MSHWVLTILPKDLFSFAWSPSEYRNATFSSISLSSIPMFFPPNSPMLGLTGLLEIASVAWGALLYLPSVQTICTQSGQGAGLVWLHVTNVHWHPPTPRAAILFLKLPVSLQFLILFSLTCQACGIGCVFMINRRPSWQLSEAAQTGEQIQASVHIYIYIYA